MNIHYLQHESFEDLASIFQWADMPGNTITSTQFFKKNYSLPNPDEVDLLIIMGGPMGVYDEDQYDWLKEEKKFIKEVISKGKKVLGICLGAQLIAEVLGAKVYKNKYKEIGWFDVQFTEASKDDFYFKEFPSSMKVFQWHGDTFDLPEGATHLAESVACRHQAFSYNNQVIALQFHMEATKKSIRELVENCKEELVNGPYIQREDQIIVDSSNLENMNNYMFALLDKMK